MILVSLSLKGSRHCCTTQRSFQVARRAKLQKKLSRASLAATAAAWWLKAVEVRRGGGRSVNQAELQLVAQQVDFPVLAHYLVLHRQLHLLVDLQEDLGQHVMLLDGLEGGDEGVGRVRLPPLQAVARKIFLPECRVNQVLSHSNSQALVKATPLARPP